MGDLIKKVYEDFKESARAALEDELGLHEPGCEAFPYQFGSPIEEILFWSFATLCQEKLDNITLYCGFSADIRLPDDNGHFPEMECYASQIGHRNHVNPDNFCVVSQCKIGKYRADFLIEIWSSPTPIRAVIECDGHDFHERTKAQAAHDRSRDRYMQTRGLPVLRFTGSEINADPRKCAEQIYEFFEAARMARARGGR